MPAAPESKNLWKTLPVRDGLEPHEVSDAKLLPAPDGFRLVGARVRGRKHAHEGTNCDDWFEMDTVGPWSIIAVSDGAGSEIFSRVGAKTSTLAAVRLLKERLANHTISPRDGAADYSDRSCGDLQFVEQSLHEAMREALRAVEQAVADRCDNPDYSAALGGRKLRISDLSATLTLAVHAQVQREGQLGSLVMACQVGDGMAAAVHGSENLTLLAKADHGSENLTLLAKADHGDYGGETAFLTSRGRLDPDPLRQSTLQHFSKLPVQALMVMTDGVADDYFPPDPEMRNLYWDLRPGLGKNAEPHVWLRDFLDSYDVRGSFDDRTLVILYPEALSVTTKKATLKDG